MAQIYNDVNVLSHYDKLRSLHEPEHHDDTVDQDVYGL
jgi:hypothetical protein